MFDRAQGWWATLLACGLGASGCMAADGSDRLAGGAAPDGAGDAYHPSPADQACPGSAFERIGPVLPGEDDVNDWFGVPDDQLERWIIADAGNFGDGHGSVERYHGFRLSDSDGETIGYTLTGLAQFEHSALLRSWLGIAIPRGVAKGFVVEDVGALEGPFGSATDRRYRVTRDGEEVRLNGTRGRVMLVTSTHGGPRGAGLVVANGLTERLLAHEISGKPCSDLALDPPIAGGWAPRLPVSWIFDMHRRRLTVGGVPFVARGSDQPRFEKTADGVARVSLATDQCLSLTQDGFCSKAGKNGLHLSYAEHPSAEEAAASFAQLLDGLAAIAQPLDTDSRFASVSEAHVADFGCNASQCVAVAHVRRATLVASVWLWVYDPTEIGGDRKTLVTDAAAAENAWVLAACKGVDPLVRPAYCPPT
jgi:hypothetical protein